MATDPLASVRSSCQFVTSIASNVLINDQVIEDFTESVTESSISELRNGVVWDDKNWHYSMDAGASGPLTCQYIFVLDSLNFCFWPNAELEYDTLSISLKTVLEGDESSFSAERLATISEDVVASWFPTAMPLLEERVLRLRELGEVLLECFDGLAANLVQLAKGSAVELVKLLLRYLPGFRDTAIYKGKLIHFYKRAQILVGDLWAAYGRRQGSELYGFRDIDQLTMFADYRVPQLLRSLGILDYSEGLQHRIDSKQELPWAGVEEVEIRAATVVAVTRIKESLQRRHLCLKEIEIDWLLWQQGEDQREKIAPHHRTLSIYY